MHLDGRRVRSDLTEAFNIINGYYDVTLHLFFTFDDAGRIGHSNVVQKKKYIGYKEALFFKYNCGQMECIA